jgi:mutator family transposase
MHRLHQDERVREELLLDLDEIARQGAKRMLAEALEAEVEAYLEAARAERDEQGRALVVRNGYAREREVLLGAGTIEVRAPRVNDRRVDQDGNRKGFKSAIVPPYVRRSPKVTEVLPLAAAVSARALKRGLRASVGGVLRHRGGAFGLYGNPPDRAVADRARALHEGRSLRARLRVCVGGRHPHQGEVGRR